MKKQKSYCGELKKKRYQLWVAVCSFCSFFLLIPLRGYAVNSPEILEVQQQSTGKVTGTVRDAQGEPIIGANVIIVGTTQGVITDLDGRFSVTAKQGDKIKVSFIGYKDQVVTVRKGTNLTVTMEEDAQVLGEVQVVAYGTQKKVSITGAISSMKGDDLLKTPAGSLNNVLSVFLPFSIPVNPERMLRTFMCGV